MEHTTFADLDEMLLKDYRSGRVIDRMELWHRPDLENIQSLIEQMFTLLFLGFYPDRVHQVDDPELALSMTLEDVRVLLRREIANVLPYVRPEASRRDCANEARDLADSFLSKLPMIREYLDTDLQAILDGDPAAACKDVILFAYPGFYAITVYRLAHELYLLNIPMIPRILTEHAHSRTGIDINPGATIGKYFFIDHGTGIVLGETPITGDHVKVYQGVTLGALSTRGGQSLRGKKRHPTIEDYVTLYACASVLGDTTIGHDSIIGSNVFITSDIPANTTVSIRDQDLSIRERHSTRS